MLGAGAQGKVWENLSTGETFTIDNRTGNSYHSSPRFTVGTGPVEGRAKRRTMQTPRLITEENDQDKNNTGEDHIPNWLREALQVCFSTPTPRAGPRH